MAGNIDSYYSLLDFNRAYYACDESDCAQSSGDISWENSFDQRSSCYCNATAFQFTLNRLWQTNDCPAMMLNPKNDFSQELIDHFYEGQQLAHNGSYDDARALWENDLICYALPEEQTFVYENLTWLSLFFEDDVALYEYASTLRIFDPRSSLALYALAHLSYKSADYDQAFYHLQELMNEDRAQLPDPMQFLVLRLLKALKKKTGPDAYDTAKMQKMLLDRAVFFQGDMAKLELLAFSRYHIHQAVSQETSIHGLFANAHITTVDQFVSHLRALIEDPSLTISSDDLPWLVHLYIRNFLHYVVSRSSILELDEIFVKQQYDCTEYARLMCYVLKQFGYEAEILYYQSGQDAQWHAYCAYEKGNDWGYASPLSFSNRVFHSKDELLKQKAWDVYDGDVYSKTWSNSAEDFVSVFDLEQ